MRKAVAAWLLPLFLWGVPEAEAQKTYRIASLNTAEQFADALEGFKGHMTELGYVEGRDIRYDFHNARGDAKALQQIAKKIVEERIDMIVTTSTSATVAAARATQGGSIPVVFLSAGNPQKLVKEFTGSGTNIAGISSATLELTEKRLELLKELVPSVKRIVSLSDPAGVNYQSNTNVVRQGAKKLGLALREIEVRDREELAKRIQEVTRRSTDGIFTPPDSLITDAIELLVAQAMKEKLPLITSLRANVKSGCLATYAANYFALGRQGAVIVDKILKGANPAELPIELPSKLNLIINLKTARSIGVKVPKEILLRADEVIE